MYIQASKSMENLGQYKTNCGFGSINARIRKIQPYIAEKGEVMEEEEEEAKSIGFEEEEEDHEAKSMDVEEEDAEEEEKKHICCQCGKGFKSGKALGGHKRIHVLETRKLSTMVKPKMVYGVASRSEKGDKVDVDCCVCHKKFTSMKALYGHMRFHPNRGWKGVMPPLLHPLGHSSASTLSIDHGDDDYDDDDDDENSELWDNVVVDLKESIKGGWLVTGKRGRRSVLKDVDAKNLLVLANTAEAANMNGTETYKEMNKKRRKKKRLYEMEKESSSSSTHHERQLEIVVGDGEREKHVCVTCNKSFASYQALGGHRASHNKLKNHQATALLLGTEASPQGSNNGDHVCNICHKIFPTGQALGGHKRRHWAGPVSTEAATEAQTAPAAASSSQRTEIVQEVIKPKRMLLEFDLNELPPNEEKEERV